MICLGLNLQWGQTGLFNVGVAGFVGIGAYASALLTTPATDAHRWVGACRSRSAGSARCWLGRRFRADRLRDAAAALGLSRDHDLRRRGDDPSRRAQRAGADRRTLWHRLHSAAVRRTRGPAAAVQRPQSRARRRARSGALCRARAARAQPWGRVLRAIREDETAAASLGKSPSRYRLQAFALGGAIMGLGGAVQAHFIGFIAPDNYLSSLTFLVWTMLILGGSGNNRGAILGGVLVWALWSGSGVAIGAIFPPTSRPALRRCRSSRSASFSRRCCCAAARPDRRAGDRLAPSRRMSEPRSPTKSVGVDAHNDPDARAARSRPRDQPHRHRSLAGRGPGARGRPLDPEAASSAMLDYARAGFDTFDMADHYGSAEIIAGRFLQRVARRRGRGRDATGRVHQMVPDAGADDARDRARGRRARARAARRRDDRPHAIPLVDLRAPRLSRRDEGTRGVARGGADPPSRRHQFRHGASAAAGEAWRSRRLQPGLVLAARSPRGGRDERVLSRARVRLLAYGTLGGRADLRALARPARAGAGEIADWSKSKYKRFVDAIGGWPRFKGSSRRWRASAQKHGVSLANVATRWTLDHPAVAAVIVGARLGERDHSADNVRAFASSWTPRTGRRSTRRWRRRSRCRATAATNIVARRF